MEALAVEEGDEAAYDRVGGGEAWAVAGEVEEEEQQQERDGEGETS